MYKLHLVGYIKYTSKIVSSQMWVNFSLVFVFVYSAFQRSTSGYRTCHYNHNVHSAKWVLTTNTNNNNNNNNINNYNGDNNNDNNTIATIIVIIIMYGYNT